MCPLCFSNDIGDEKHYSFHCTNPKLVEMRKRFIGLICIKRLPHFQMLTWSMYHSERLLGMNYNRIGNYLSLMLVKTQHLFIEVERHKRSTS